MIDPLTESHELKRRVDSLEKDVERLAVLVDYLLGTSAPYPISDGHIHALATALHTKAVVIKEEQNERLLKALEDWLRKRRNETPIRQADGDGA